MSELIRWNPALFLIKAGLIIEVKIRITSYSTFAPLRCYKGFRMLTLGWTDGATFIPIEFSLLSSKKSQINGISKTQHKIRV